MKKVKFVFWLIVLICLGLLIYQNQEYFFSTGALQIDLKINTWQWTLPEIQTIAFMGICFVIGFIWAGILGLSSKFKSKKEVKALNQTIDSHAAQISSLKTELEVYINDPYIRKQGQEKKEALPEASVPQDTPRIEEASSDAAPSDEPVSDTVESTEEPETKDAL